ncbi:MAG: uracil-DNA glycosylase, partial [Gammaproteobacteria bacterium]|nr:uracil-DNA glycosylase [Gammaproteobacteria bacterium]
MDWDALQQAASTCRACELHETRNNVVFGVGEHNASLMFIGEAPGAEEDRQGEPFVGAAGQLLNAMLKAIGLSRSDVFIANMLKCRPPGNRDPQPSEVAAC